MTIAMIAAVDLDGGIAKDGKIPWKLKTDMRRFKALTTGCPIVMGRKTFESLPKLLPGRQHLVLSNNREWRLPEDAGFNTELRGYGLGPNRVFHTVAELVEHLRGGALKVWVIGGAEIYAAFAPKLADEIHLTVLQAYYACDRFFPKLPLGLWREVESMEFPDDDDNECAFRFVTYRADR